MKRIGFLFFLCALCFSFFLPLASAYYFPDVRFQSENVIQLVIDFFEPVLQVVLGGYEWGPDLLFERLLLFILLVSVIYLALGNVPVFEDQKRIRWLVAILIPLIGVRFLDYAWIVTIITQYQVLAIALTAILPFIVYFFFLYGVASEHPVIRKIGWVFFIVIYFGLWATVERESYSVVYFWTMVVSLVFLLFDGTIYGYYERQKMKAAGAGNKWQHIAAIKEEIDKLRAGMGAGHIPDKTAQKLIKKKQKQLAWVMKHM